jgi:hypothetical protein
MPTIARRFQFVPHAGAYHGPEPAIGCDGRVPGAALDLTHWQGNHTPDCFRADTSTEMALKFVAAPASFAWADAVVVNNHFDTDGVLSIWTLLDPPHALAQRDLLIAAAEAGDFEEWPTPERGLWLDAAIRALAATARDEAESYAVVLPQLAELIATLDARRDLWGAAWDQLQRSKRSFDAGRLTIERHGPIGLARHAPGEPEAPGPLLARWLLPGSQRYLLAFDQGDGTWTYRYERPRYAWAVTVVRPQLPDPDAAALAQSLGEGWTADDLPGLTGLVQTLHPTPEPPEILLERLRLRDPLRFATAQSRG